MSDKVDLAKVKAVLALSTESWSRLRAAIRGLNDAEFELVEQAERETRRRLNVLNVLKAERSMREGRPEKMMHLRMEVNR